MSPILLHLIPATLYAGLGVWFWRGIRKNPGTLYRMSTVERSILLLTLVIQGFALHSELFHGNEMRFGFGLAISLMIWLAICFYWIEALYTRLDGLHAVIIPSGLFASLIPILFPGEHVLANAGTLAFRAHFIMAMLAYSLFVLAAMHALLMAMVERRLHTRRFSKTYVSLPPLLTMESMLFRLITAAFVLLTLTLVSGMSFSELLFGKPFRLDHKTFFAIVTWILFGVLLVGRHIWGWRGKRALRWTLAGFVALMLTYVGTRFVIEIVLQKVS